MNSWTWMNVIDKSSLTGFWKNLHSTRENNSNFSGALLLRNWHIFEPVLKNFVGRAAEFDLESLLSRQKIGHFLDPKKNRVFLHFFDVFWKVVQNFCLMSGILTLKSEKVGSKKTTKIYLASFGVIFVSFWGQNPVLGPLFGVFLKKVIGRAAYFAKNT